MSKELPLSENKSHPKLPDAVQVLVVDTEVGMLGMIRNSIPDRPVSIKRVKSLAEARQVLASNPIDLAVVRDELPDGQGLELVAELEAKKTNHPNQTPTHSIVVGETPTAEQALEALRAGVSDFIDTSAELDLAALNLRVQEVLAKQEQDKKQIKKIKRLRRTCKKLSAAKTEVSEQVDVLCNDLVTAYQELAGQVHQVMHSSEFGTLIKEELDFEQVLRKTLEYVVEKVGPTNAAIFLPSSMDEYSLGGYVNYDCTQEGADILLQHLADAVAPQIAEKEDLVYIADDRTMQHYVGEEFSFMQGNHLVALRCRHEDETLAVLVLFRDGRMPFDEDTQETCIAVSPILGETLARVIRVHHRALPEIDLDGEFELNEDTFDTGLEGWKDNFDTDLDDDDDSVPF